MTPREWHTRRREEAKVIGRRLKALRQTAGLTQKQVAQLAGCIQGTWQRWETGASMPDFTRAPDIAQALSVPIEALFAPDDCAPLATFIVGPESLKRLQGPERAQALDELTALMASQLRSLLEQARPVVVPQKATHARPRRSREQVLAELKRRPKPRREIT